ncbi:MAG TPA: VWA domain-containing protein, partial [Dehalococcoidia bacterium]|nr:VWA domain-containing protein [Dehalococcoidia bacterium]
MRELLRRGGRLPSGRQMPGMRDLLDRLKERRQQQLQRYNLDSVMDDIKQKLEEVVQKEREGIERRLSEQSTAEKDDGEAGVEDDSQQFRDLLESMARKHLDQLDNLPPQVGGRIQQLRDYDFMDSEARQRFEELLDTLKKQVMEQFFQQLKQSLGAMTPEQMGEIQQMVRDLNELLAAHRQGDDSGFKEFMNKWGQFFPDGLQNVDQLTQHLSQQMAAMQSLLESMTPEMRGELDQMISSLFQDGDLQSDLAELMMNLDDLYPTDRGDPMPFAGDDPLTLQEALRLMGDINGLDELERELTEAARDSDATQLDTDEIGRLIGDEARRMAEELQQLSRMLEDAGLIRRRGSEWELTPRAMRKIGERALRDIFGRIDGGLAGDHSLNRDGWGIERLEDTKAYQWGDPFALDMHGTLGNALRRNGPGTPQRIAVDDFEVFRSAFVNQCATVIMLDMSYSMLRRGRFLAGRKVAMALDSLIRNKFPRDVLHVAAFSYFVQPLKSHMLLETSWIDPRGTDFPVAIHAAREMLKGYKDGTKQIILITDGEPHANAYGYDYGRYEGGWSMREAMEETLREVNRCTRSGITVNTFMLDTEPVITTFIKTLAKLNRGRIFFADPSQLGEYLLVDYMKNRRARA